MNNSHAMASDLANSLRAILPYAENEISALADVEHRDNEVLGYTEAHEHLLQAKQHLAEWDQVSATKDILTNHGALDTLIALVERGPLPDGEIPSKAGRDLLIERGLAAKIIIIGSDGHQAATYFGASVYQAAYGGNSLQEAMARRKAGVPIQL